MKYFLRALSLPVALVPAAALAAGNIIHVANNGIDGAGCGNETAPCRSIGAGISAAMEGDTVLVRPGRYGELDGDDALGGPGEETGFGYGVVDITKPVNVLSTHGAGSTTIRGISSLNSVVFIAADGAQFGERHAGFTLYGSGSEGVGSAGDVASGKIAGNIARDMVVGFQISSMGAVEISHNTAIGNYGFGIIGNSSGDSAGTVFIHHNLVQGTGNGVGIVLGGRGAHRASANESSRNDIGLQLAASPARVTQNVISNNRIAIAYTGYSDGPPAGLPIAARNALVGNSGGALWVSPFAEFDIAFRQNNIYGNDYCTVQNLSALDINARQNFWGSIAGPGFGADACDAGTGQTRKTPFSATEIPIQD